MAWPNTRLRTYLANGTPSIKAADLNAIQDAINDLYNVVPAFMAKAFGMIKTGASPAVLGTSYGIAGVGNGASNAIRIQLSVAMDHATRWCPGVTMDPLIDGGSTTYFSNAHPVDSTHFDIYVTNASGSTSVVNLQSTTLDAYVWAFGGH